LVLHNPNRLRIALVLIVLVVVVGVGIANYQFSIRVPGGNDFLARWVGAHYWVVKGVNPYDPQVSLASQEMIYGRPADPTIGEDVAHFVYPLPSMIFFAPFALVSYPVARAIWMTLLEICLPILALIGIQLARWKPSRRMLLIIMIFSLVWYHGFRSVILGQFAVIEAVLMTGALLAIQKRRDGLAGVLLALSIAKPQMPVLLIPFVLLWAIRSKRRTIILWMLGSLAVLIGISLLLIPKWPLLWLQQMVDYPTYTANPTPVSIIAGILPSASNLIAYGLNALLMLYLLWEWVVAMGKGDRWFQWTAALTIVITNLLDIRTGTTNYVVMLPALCMIFWVWDDRWGKKGNIAIVALLMFLLVGLWTLFLVTVEGNLENNIMYLPLPILTLLGLLWSRWWIVRMSLIRPNQLSY
jgi:hypothetical protein